MDHRRGFVRPAAVQELGLPTVEEAGGDDEFDDLSDAGALAMALICEKPEPGLTAARFEEVLLGLAVTNELEGAISFDDLRRSLEEMSEPDEDTRTATRIGTYMRLIDGLVASGTTAINVPHARAAS